MQNVCDLKGIYKNMTLFKSVRKRKEKEEIKGTGLISHLNCIIQCGLWLSPDLR